MLLALPRVVPSSSLAEPGGVDLVAVLEPSRDSHFAAHAQKALDSSSSSRRGGGGKFIRVCPSLNLAKVKTGK